MIQPDRTYSSGNLYRYGFNGKEKDKDISSLTAYDYGFRIYNPAIGRFLSVDPLTQKYPWYTPYQFAGNKPIVCIDLDGAEETIPFIQQAAFDCIDGQFSNVCFVRGKRGANLGSQLPDESTSLNRFLDGLCPLQWASDPFAPPAYIAQAINFGNSIGSVVYDYTEYQAGNNYEQITNKKEAFLPGKLGHSVYLNVSSSTEVGIAIFDNLRSMSELKDLGDAEIRGFIERANIVFEPGKDYSYLFWTQQGGELIPQMQYIQYIGIGPTTIPMRAPVTTFPIVLPPVGGSGSINTPSGTLIVSTAGVANDIAATLAPTLVQMAKKKLQGKTELEKAQEQLEGIENAQENLKQNKLPGQSKQSKINSIKKSKQRLNNALRDIKNSKDVEE